MVEVNSHLGSMVHKYNEQRNEYCLKGCVCTLEGGECLGGPSGKVRWNFPDGERVEDGIDKRLA